MPFEVYREAPDGLSREVWRFRETGSHGFFLSLDEYGTQRRKLPKGRFAKMRPEDRWSVSDERHYWSGVNRPESIPDDVMREAVSMVKVQVFVGYTNSDRLKAEYTISVTDAPEHGRAPSGQAGRASHGAASSTASPPFGDHPSREALRRIAWLRPAGDVCGVGLKDALRLIEEMERIALDALGEGL